MYDNKIIAHNLKAAKEQIIDDLNGIMSPLQRKMMRTLLKHLDNKERKIKAYLKKLKALGWEGSAAGQPA